MTSTWTCTRCTLINDTKATRCAVCQYPRPQASAILTGAAKKLFVFNAGSTEVNGEYKVVGTSDGAARYVRISGDNKMQIVRRPTDLHGVTKWFIGTPDRNCYVVKSDKAHPPLTGWSQLPGASAPVPELSARDQVVLPLALNFPDKGIKGRYFRVATCGGRGLYTRAKPDRTRFLIYYQDALDTKSEEQDCQSPARWALAKTTSPCDMEKLKTAAAAGDFKGIPMRVLFTCETKSRMPPLTRWTGVGGGLSVACMTAEGSNRSLTGLRASAALSAVDAKGLSVLVIGAGSLETNGRYTLMGVMNGTSVFRKYSENNTKEYAVMRATGSKTKQTKWWICRTDRNGIRSDIDFYSVVSDAKLPPPVGWARMRGGLEVPQVCTDSAIFFVNSEIPQIEGRYVSSGMCNGAVSFARQTRDRKCEIVRERIDGQGTFRWVMRSRSTDSGPGQGSVHYEVLFAGVTPKLRGWTVVGGRSDHAGTGIEGSEASPEIHVRPTLYVMCAGAEETNGEYRVSDDGVTSEGTALRFEQFQSNSKSAAEWSCPRCTMLNPPAKSQCGACLSPKPASKSLRGDHAIVRTTDAKGSFVWRIVNIKTQRAVYEASWQSEMPPFRRWRVSPEYGDAAAQRAALPAPDLTTAKDAAYEKRIQAEIRSFRDSGIKIGTAGEMKLDAIISTLKAKSLNFVDLEFPPSDESIYAKKRKAAARPGLPVRERENYVGDVRWLRPGSFMGKDYDLYKDITADDITQGKLGNCWFCCSLSCLAEQPDRIRGLIENKVRNDEGIYRVSFCSNGQWRTVTIDDYIPCFPAAGPIFSRNNGDELWVLLVEKAYAKLYGGYTSLRGGHEFQSLEDLTGLPSMRIRLQAANTKMVMRENLVWPALLRCANAGMVMTCGTGPPQMYAQRRISPQMMRSQTGLAPSHAYSLLTVKEAAGLKLVRIRNPWGTGEWRGDYSDDSRKWTQEALAAFRPRRVDDGVFFMPWDQMANWFMDICICFTVSTRNRAWWEERIPGKFCNDSKASRHGRYVWGNQSLAVSCTEETSYCFQIHQQDKRHPDAPAYLEIGLCVVNSQTGQLVGTSFVSEHRKAMTQCLLKPGHYVIVPFCGRARLPASTSRSYMVTVHGDNKAGRSLQSVAVDGPMAAKAVKAMPNFIDYEILNRINSIVTNIEVTRGVTGQRSAQVDRTKYVFVQGSGSAEADGAYQQAGFRGGAYEFKRSDAKTHRTYSVCRSRSSQTGVDKWWVCRTDRVDIKADIDFYNVASQESLPPATGWTPLKHSKAPVPLFSTDGQLCVTGLKPSAACGEYKAILDASSGEHKWTMKKGTETYTISRLNGRWCIWRGASQMVCQAPLDESSRAMPPLCGYVARDSSSVPSASGSGQSCGDAWVLPRKVSPLAQSLRSMGFTNLSAVISALQKSKFDLNQALTVLLAQPQPSLGGQDVKSGGSAGGGPGGGGAAQDAKNPPGDAKSPAGKIQLHNMLNCPGEHGLRLMSSRDHCCDVCGNCKDRAKQSFACMTCDFYVCKECFYKRGGTASASRWTTW